ncbi:hypothetical protein D3C73_1022020 [compost metagenome]
MSGEQDRSTWSFIHTTALHSDKTILNHVHASDTMFSAEFIQLFHNAKRVQALTIQSHAFSLFEFKLQIFRLIRSILRRCTQEEHIFIFGSGGIEPRVLQYTALIANMQQVAVHRIWLRC